MRQPKTFLLCLSSLISWLFACALTPLAMAISIRDDQTASPHNALAAQFPATGYFGTTAGQSCTATLVAPNLLLTAAHCVDSNADGNPDDLADVYAFGLELNIPLDLTGNVASIAINPGWASSAGDASFDIAVITLSTPIASVQPALITSENPVGQLGAAIGYGEQGTGTSRQVPTGAKDKLAVQNVIDRLGGAPAITSNDTLQFDFDHPDGSTNTLGSSVPLDLEGATAGGDSGGPLMAKFGEAWFLTGILNTGYNDFGADSRYGDVSIYAPILVPSNLVFLQDQGVRIITDTTPIPGDANLDYWVDESDLQIWQAGFGSGTSRAQGDSDGDNDVDSNDFLTWQRHFADDTGVDGAAISLSPSLPSLDLPTGLSALGIVVPEPCTSLLAVYALIASALAAARKRAAL